MTQTRDTFFKAKQEKECCNEDIKSSFMVSKETQQTTPGAPAYYFSYRHVISHFGSITNNEERIYNRLIGILTTSHDTSRQQTQELPANQLKDPPPGKKVLASTIRFRVNLKVPIEEVNKFQKRVLVKDDWTNMIHVDRVHKAELKQFYKKNIHSVQIEILNNNEESWYLYKELDNPYSSSKSAEKNDKKIDEDDDKPRKKRFFCF